MKTSTTDWIPLFKDTVRGWAKIHCITKKSWSQYPTLLRCTMGRFAVVYHSMKNGGKAVFEIPRPD